MRGTRSVFAERNDGGYFLDVDWKREELARYGLSIDDAQSMVQNAIGGENVTTTIEGRERYPVNVRYMADFRSEIGDLERLPVPAADGQRQIPLAQLATIKTATGPSMVRNEDGLLTGYVYVDLADRDVPGYVEDARRVLASEIQLPPGVTTRVQPDLNAFSVLAPTVEEEPVVAEVEAAAGPEVIREKKEEPEAAPASGAKEKAAPKEKEQRK